MRKPQHSLTVAPPDGRRINPKIDPEPNRGPTPRSPPLPSLACMMIDNGVADSTTMRTDLERSGAARSDRRDQLIYRIAFVLAVVGSVAGQLHALARHATPDGHHDLDSPLTRAWAVPAARALRPLLDWSDPMTVYVSYGRVWTPVFLAGLLCAVVVYRRRRPLGAERVAWWLTLGAFGLLTLSVVGDYFTPWMDQAFMIGVGAIMLFLTASTVLGVMLIKNRFRPRSTAVIMVAQLPLFLVIASITSLGNTFIPFLLAIVITAHHMLSPRSCRP